MIPIWISLTRFYCQNLLRKSEQNGRRRLLLTKEFYGTMATLSAILETLGHGKPNFELFQDIDESDAYIKSDEKEGSCWCQRISLKWWQFCLPSFTP